jgi:DNA polymerase II large subunit
MPQAYCVKDRKMVEMRNPQQITLKNGRPAMQGTCPQCGTKVTRIGGGGGATAKK